MKKAILVLAVCTAFSAAAEAQNWSFGAGTGAFVFGTFVKRTLITGTETGTGEQTTKLSAKTRPGVSIDLERSLAPHWAIRLEGTFTHAPLAAKGGGSGIALNVGTMNVATAMLPVVFRINPNGTFRVHLMGGPAYAEYHAEPSGTSNLRPFAGNRGRLGFAGGGGIAWQLSHTFAVEGQITDISTSSPFERRDFPTTGLVKITIPRTENVHTTVGIRYRF
ncbi:MAG TPA: outer membrane beta-barrel protein [Thermoanaerobaculia bacterium]|nr:outer membrane beta-barrel protein [Thermoanaerobaculia bacterium]